MQRFISLIRSLPSHTLARSSIIVFIGALVANIGSYLYHLAVGRILGPGGYGELSSLISILYIFSAPIVVLQTILVKYFSFSKATNSVGQAKDFYIRITRNTVQFLIIFGIVVALLSPFVSRFLHLSNWTYIVWTYGIFVFSLLSVVPSSLLQAFQKFVLFSLLGAGVIICKLLLSIPAAAIGVEATLQAAVLSGFIFYILYLYSNRFMLQSARVPYALSKKEFISENIPTLLAIVGIISLFSTDVVLAKHFLTSYQAGIYASLSILGKIIFYASYAVVSVIFPVLSERFVTKKDSKNVIRFAFVSVVFISLSVTSLFFAFPKIIVGLLYGSAYEGAVSYLGTFGIFMTLYSVLNVITYICLALKDRRIWMYIFGGSLLQILGIFLFHQNIEMIVTVNIVVTLATLVCVLLYDKRLHI